MKSDVSVVPALVLICLMLTSGCQVVLGFEDHRLADTDGGLEVHSGGGGTGGTQMSNGGSASGGTQSTSSGGTHQGQTGSGGRSDANTGTAAACDTCVLKKALVHRYSFEGSGTQATDSVGNAHGTVVGTTQSGQGSVVLSGWGEYVDLPNGIISSLTNATFEAWIRWRGGDPWQRVFDFGNSSSTLEGEQGSGVTYLLLTPAADSSYGSPRVVFSRSGTNNETRLSASNDLPRNETVHIALVFDATGNTFSLFINGARDVSASITSSLSDLTDVNNWLGHSQFESDADFDGTFYEFRIYDAALSSAQLHASYELGPDAIF